MKITIDQEKCIGCGSCTAVCPDVFEMDENNKAQVKKEKEEATDECVQEAVDICPVQAIEIEK
jgi:ferredoxin